MHVLVSNNDAEISAFRRAIGTLADELRVVENNLGALSLVGSGSAEIEALVITGHQDEGVNIPTPTFVRNMADTVPIVVVGAFMSDQQSDSVEVVDTIEEAADLLRVHAQPPVPVAGHGADEAEASANGHGLTDLSDTAVVNDHRLSLPAREAHIYGSDNQSETPPASAQSARGDRTGASMASGPGTETPEAVPESAHSLADDIRDWTERNEQQRGQTHGPATGRSIWQRINDLMPANRSAREEEAELDKAIRAPRITHCHNIAVISPKGGVGKSFLTYIAGNFLAEVRGDKVVAIDTNPDFGTLADQVRGREQQTVGTLLEHLQTIRHYSDLRRFTSKVESRLEVLAAPADPDAMATITAADYGMVHKQLNHYYDTVLFDCGTGFRDDITRFALQQSDQILLVSAPLFITTGIVIRALGYLNQIGCDLSRVTLAINQVRKEKPLDIDYMRARFGSRLNAIVEIPFDIQLYHSLDRGEFNIDQLDTSTRVAVKRLVAELVSHFE